MKRREFITLLGGAAAAWPLTARAQQAAMPIVGLLSGGASPDSAERELLTFFRQGLSETGYIEGQNLAIEYRWAEFQNDRLPSLAADLVKRGVDVIVTFVGTNAGLAAKAATSSIPIVVITGDDLVRVGLVASLNRPGGNVTGVSAIPTALGPKRLELLRALMPKAGRIGLLVNVNSPDAEVTMQEVPAAARRLGQEIIVATAGSEAEIDAAFAMLARRQAGALLLGPDPFFGRKVAQLVAAPRVTGFQPCTGGANLWPQAASSATERAFPIVTAKPGSMPGAFCAALGRQICRSCSRPASNS
jgi:putative ABC transport system substrate-binding protein